MSDTSLYFAAAVVAAERCARNGMPIEAQTLVSEDPDIPILEADRICQDPRFARALEEVGVNFSPRERLSNQQIAAARLYLADTSRSHAAKLRAAGISQAKWSGWMRQPLFVDYITQHSIDTMYGALPATHLAVSEKASSGEAWAVNLLYQITGFHDPNKVDDPRPVFEAIFEVLSDEGVSEAILTKVGQRMREVMGGAPAAPGARPAMIVMPATPQREAS